jgi:mitochondrial fission protein ELM1
VRTRCRDGVAKGVRTENSFLAGCMSPVTALLLSDDRPGHYHLAEGVIAAVRRLKAVDVVRLEVRRGAWPGAVLAAYMNAGFSPQWLLRSVYGLDAGNLPQAHLIVSAGAETLAANAAVARLLHAPNVFYGSLRGFRPESFALVLTSYARYADRPRHVIALKPSSIDPATLPVRPVAQQLGPARPPRLAGLLIGGDAGGFSYTPDDWSRLIGFLGETHRAWGTRWIVSNSRRTPDAVSGAISSLAAGVDGPITEFIDVRAVGAGTLRGVLERVEAIVCTDDSSTMVSESISALLPTVGVTPARHAFTEEERGYRAFLAANGWYRSLTITALTPERVLAELVQIRPLTENPLDWLAAILRERLPGLFQT